MKNMPPLPEKTSSAKGIVLLAIMFILAYSASMAWYTYDLLMECSEHAYAMALWKRGTQGVRDLEALVKTLAGDVQNAHIETDSATGASMEQALLADLRAHHASLILGSTFFSPQGRQIRSDTTESRYFPDSIDLAAPEWKAIREKRTPALIEPADGKAATNSPWVSLYIPVYNDSGFHGFSVLALSINTLGKMVVSRSSDSMLTYCWLRGSNSLLAGAAPPDYSALNNPIKSRLLMDDSDKGQIDYMIVDIEGIRQLVLTIPVNLPERNWTMGLAMQYTGVRTTPHALFKGLVIISAWAVPLIAFLVLISIRSLLMSGIKRERIFLHKELDEAQSKLLALIEMSREVVYLANPEDPTVVPFISHRIEDLTGYAAVEFIADSRLWARLIHPDDREFVTFERSRLMTEKRPLSLEYRLRHRADRYIRILETAQPILDAKGNVAQIMGLLTAKDANKEFKNAHDPQNGQIEYAQSATTLPPRKAHILLVDDDRLLVKLCVTGLRQAGIGITPAYDGLDAIELFKENPGRFDAIVLDMVMPRMSGLEAIQHLQSIRPDVKIIGISGYSTDGKEWDIHGQKVQGFLSKPFEIEDLVGTLNRVFRGDSPSMH